MARPRKNPVQENPPVLEETPAPDNQTDQDDAVRISFEKADDYEPSKKSVADEIKSFFKGFTEGEKPSGDGTAKKRTLKTFENKTKLVAKGLVWAMGQVVPELQEKFIISDGEKDVVCQLLPTEKQADNIVRPLLRIVDRHTQVKGVNPDLVDLASAGASLVEYAWVTHANLVLLRQIKEMEAQNNAQNNHQQSYTNGLESRGPEGNVPAYQTESDIP